MIGLGHYREFGFGDDCPSIKDMILPESYENQELVYRYLSISGYLKAVTCGYEKDIFDNTKHVRNVAKDFLIQWRSVINKYLVNPIYVIVVIIFFMVFSI